MRQRKCVYPSSIPAFHRCSSVISAGCSIANGHFRIVYDETRRNPTAINLSHWKVLYSLRRKMGTSGEGSPIEVATLCGLVFAMVACEMSIIV
jgi:hypothetical protein